MAKRAYVGPPLDDTGQHIADAPYWQEIDGDGFGETVYATQVADGASTAENVPLPDGSSVRCQFPGCDQVASGTTYCVDCRAACVSAEE